MKLLLYLSLILFLPYVSTATDIKINLSDSEKARLSDGKIVFREVPANNQSGKTFEAIGLIQATVDEVFQVLTKFEDYHVFQPHVTSVNILERGANHALLDFTLTLPLGKRKRYRLSETFENSGSSAVIKWEKSDWPELKRRDTINDSQGYWFVTNYPAKKEHVIAVYHIYTDPGPIPPGLGWIADILSKKSVPKVVVNTREYVYKIFKRDK